MRREPHDRTGATRDGGSRRYGSALALAVVVLGAATAWAFAMLTPSSRRVVSEDSVPPLETGDTMAIRNVAQIRPDAAAYEAFGEVDREWRAAAIARFRAGVRAGGTDAPWQPSAEQQLDDAVFARVREGRVGEAVELLAAWLEGHPQDVARHRSAAVLLAQLGRRDAAVAHRAAALRARPQDDVLRADLARELAWSGRYAEAVVEWLRVVHRRPADRAARQALAEALAWSGQPADAEPILESLVMGDADSGTRALLRSVRGELTPSAERAARWVAQDAAWLPYRVALARALDTDGRHSAAAWDAVLADSATVALLSEAAGSAAGARDSVRSAGLLSRAVAMAPADRELRARWAQALAWSGDRTGAMREYGHLIDEADDGALRLARGQLRAWSGDLRGATVDLERAAQLAPTYEAFALLGDILRWGGEHRAARAMYEQALALRPGDASMLQAVAAARKAERLTRLASLARSVADGDPAGSTLSVRYAEDNTGYLYAAARAAHAVALGRSTVVGVAAEQRRVAQRFAHARSRWLAGYLFGATASHDLGAVRLAAAAGVARHALVRDVPYGALSATVRRRGAAVTVEAAHTTAYEQLWAMRTLVDWEAAAAFSPQPMSARTYAVRAALPVGRAGVDVSVERTRLGDGNARLGGALAARAPLRGGLSAVYTGGAMTYSDAAGAYWAPRRYDAHAAGLEYATPLAPGVRITARVLPGVVRTDDRLLGAEGRPVGMSPWAAQLSAGGDLSIERSRWSAAVSAGVGQGARGTAGQQGYRSMSGSVTVRARW